MKTTLISLLATCALASPGLAQDLVGFDASSFGSVVLSTKQSAGQGDIVLEQAIGDYNNEFINGYSAGSVFSKMGRAVGRLDVLTDAGNFPCTAFMVTDDILMTNHHCVPGILDHPRANATTIAAVQILMGYTQEGVDAGTRQFMVNPVPLETSEKLDYTLLRVLSGKPGKSFGTLDLAGYVPQDNDPYWVIGHPLGEAQRISREKCRANQPAVSGNKLLHTCDTLPGNSGSPVIDTSTRQVVALHHAGSKQNSVNYAIPMTEILRNSSILTAASQNDPDPTDPAADALAKLVTITDPAQLDAALARIVVQFPGTASAAVAQSRLDALRKQIAETDRITRENAASAELMAALVLTDPQLQKKNLQAVIRKYPDSTVATAAQATLNALLAAQVVPAPPAPQGTGANDKTAEGPSPAPDQIFAKGTVLKVNSINVFARPSETSKRVATVMSQVTLGEYVGNGWYRNGLADNRYVQPAVDAPVVAVKQLADSRVSTSAVTRPKTTDQVFAKGTVLKVNSINVFARPSETSKRVATVMSQVTLGEYVGNGWYRNGLADNRYVQPAVDAPVVGVKPLADTRVSTSTVTHPKTTDQVFAKGTVLKVNSLNVYARPSEASKHVATVMVQVTLGEYVGNGWYKNGLADNRYVNPSAQAKKVIEKQNAHPIGTKINFSGSIALYESPSVGANKKGTAFGALVLGRFVGNGWYAVSGKYNTYVQPVSGKYRVAN